MELLKSQGTMEVESKALDRAFADTRVKPRQRLISAVIDYGLDMVDCATLQFADPDYRVARAVRTGETKSGDEVIYTPWTVRIGYHDLDKSEWTTLTGVPALEVPNFPSQGPPTTTIKVFSASIMLQKNVTPGGNPANYVEPFQRAPLRTALTAIASFYGLELDLGVLDSVVTQIDHAFEINYVELAQYDPIFDKVMQYQREHGQWDWDVSPQLTGSVNDFFRLPKQSDYQYLQYVAEAITRLIKAKIDPLGLDTELTEYFNSKLPGEVSKSDLRIVFGVYAGKLVFKLAREYLLDNGFQYGIPVFDYRVGNNMLISFQGNTTSAQSNTGAWATFIKLFSRQKEQTKVEIDGPKPDVDPSKNDDPQAAALNVYMKEVYRNFHKALPINSEDYSAAWLDYVQRSLDTNIEATAQTYGIPKLMAGQLVGCTGLGIGPEDKLDEHSAAEQKFANYNRLYLIKQATHKVDQTGFYSLTMKLAGCSMDGSEKKALSALIARMSGGVESGGTDSSWWRKLLRPFL